MGQDLPRLEALAEDSGSMIGSLAFANPSHLPDNYALSASASRTWAYFHSTQASGTILGHNA